MTTRGMKRGCVVLTVVGLLVTAPAVAGVSGATPATTNTTLVVDDEGGQGVDYTTIQAAVDNASAGDTIQVNPGTYNETVRITKSLTLLGDPGDASWGVGPDAPVLDGGMRNGNAIELAPGVSDVTIAGFEIRSYTGSFINSGSGIRALPAGAGTSNITVRDNYIHSLTGFGVAANGGMGARAVRNPNWSVRNNRVEDVGFVAIAVGNARDSEIVNNRVIGSANIPGGDARSRFGIGVASISTGAGEAVRVTNNSLSGTFIGGVINLYAWAPQGVQDATLRSIRVVNNSIAGQSSGDSGPRGINIDARGNTTAGTTGTIANVTIAQNRVSGVRTGIGAGNARAGPTTIQDVHIVDNRIQGGHGAVTLRVRSNTSLADIVVRENQIEGTDHDGIAAIALDDTTVSDVRISDNRVVRGKAGITVRVAATGTIQGVTVANNTVSQSQFGLFVTRRASGTLADISVRRNTFRRNGPQPSRGREGGAGLSIAETAPADELAVHQNQFLNNRDAGIINNNATTLNATNNWWGDASGPSSPNPDNPVSDPVTGALANGTGDTVSTGVHFDPWLTTPPTSIVARYDENNSGTIDNQELLDALADYPDPVSQTDLLELLAVYDAGG